MRPYVNALGYVDPLDQGLQNSHVVQLSYDGGAGGSSTYVAASVAVPAGTAPPWYDGYHMGYDPSFAYIPEPTALSLLGRGAASVFALGLRRKN